MEAEEISRKHYIEIRRKNDQGEILRAYFNRKTGYLIDEANFFAIMFEVLEEHPGLQEDINTMYPDIVKCYDKFFHICFLTRDFGDEHVLIKMY